MKRIALILFCSAVCISVGMSVAYYNTAMTGYDNANIVSFYEDGIYILDMDINYTELKKGLNKIKEYIPDKILTISCNYNTY